MGLPSQSSSRAQPSAPSRSPDQSEPTRLSASLLFMRPELTQSRLCPRLSTPQSTLSARSQLLPMLLPQLLLMVLMLLSQLPPLLLKHNNNAVDLHKYLIVTGLCPSCTVKDNKMWTPQSCPCWLLTKLFCCWNKSNVMNMLLQYDIYFSSKIKTSGIFFVMLNVLFVRYRRELFINKSVLFL